MSSKNQSKDQKRKAKLAERDKKARVMEIFQPYAGNKYHSAHWTPVVFATEQAIHDTILESNRTLTNGQVKQALTLLIDHLRRGGPGALVDGEPEVPFSSTTIVERLFFKIRQAWRTLAESGRAISANDLTGIARTLLGSIEVQALRSGASRGYVTFLEDFIPQFQRSSTTAPGLSAVEIVELYESMQDNDSEQDE